MTSHPSPGELSHGSSQADRGPGGSRLSAIELTRSYQYEGPLPPPELVEKYEQIYPGAAKFFFEEIAKNGELRRDSERRALEAEIEDQRSQRRENRLGQTIGAGVSIFIVSISALVVLIQPNAAGATFASVLGGGTLLGLVTVFVVGRRASGQAPADDDRADAPDPGTTADQTKTDEKAAATLYDDRA